MRGSRHRTLLSVINSSKPKIPSFSQDEQPPKPCHFPVDTAIGVVRDFHDSLFFLSSLKHNIISLSRDQCKCHQHGPSGFGPDSRNTRDCTFS